MKNCTEGSIYRLVACFTVGLTAVLPGAGRASEVKVENYSNDTVYVAVAYNKWKGNLAAEGWFAIQSNESRVFTADDASDMYLRIEQGGREVTFQKHKTFLDWPVNSQRFTVGKEPDDATVRVLRSGDRLEKGRNINKGGPLPEEWNERRFFRVGPGNTKFEIKP